MIQLGIYEQLVTKMVSNKLNELDTNIFYLSTRNIDKVEASKVLTTYLSAKINLALSLISGEDSILKQIELANQIILLLASELNNNDFQDDIIETEAKILYGVFSKIDNPMVDFEKYLKEITPYSKLSQCDLFTGNNAGISLESEIKKEIRSSDEIYFLVSFIKWTGIRIFENELKEFTEKGGKLKIITTSYMGATDAKAVEFLANLPNAQVKVSYNSENERLHAKAYLFRRKTGFHTGYISSSNISKSALTTGLEWNIKVTTQEANQIIDKFYKTFETYWEDKDFTPFSTIDDREVLREALKKAKNYQNLDQIFLFDIKPFPFQEEILEKLEVEREIHNRYKNLVVAATGTGKTVISAFDFKNFDRKIIMLVYFSYLTEKKYWYKH
ncbi:MAG: phospholipase D-like domain-containing protein [Flectobacillus sp.]|nr:phospholipase D-like domain-containing protein [Flectobacillus sp.]